MSSSEVIVSSIRVNRYGWFLGSITLMFPLMFVIILLLNWLGMLPPPKLPGPGLISTLMLFLFLTALTLWGLYIFCLKVTVTLEGIVIKHIFWNFTLKWKNMTYLQFGKMARPGDLWPAIWGTSHSTTLIIEFESRKPKFILPLGLVAPTFELEEAIIKTARLSNSSISIDEGFRSPVN